MADTPKDVRAEDLSPPAQQVVAEKRLSGRKRVKEWQKLISELAEFDRISDRLEDRAGNFTILGIVLIVAALIAWFVAFVAADPGQSATLAVRIPALVAIAAGIALVIYHGRRWRYFAKVDLANDFRLCIPPFLDVLADDIEPRGKVAMDLDMAGINADKQVEKHKIPPGRFDKVVETVYHDPWCHLAATLADNSQIILDIENHFIRHDRTRTRRSASGKRKTKTKTKWKKLILVTAAVVPNAEHLQWDAEGIGARATEEKLKLAEKKGAQVCRLVRKFKFAAPKQPEDVAPPDEIIGMFMDLFAMLNPAAAARS